MERVLHLSNNGKSFLLKKERITFLHFVLLEVFRKDPPVQWSFAKIVKSMSEENAGQRQRPIYEN